jgi:hypothetical protein
MNKKKKTNFAASCGPVSPISLIFVSSFEK